MKYQQIIKGLLHQGFDRVERDDRLLDVFPDQAKEKGIELWEKWEEEEVEIARIHEPNNPQSLLRFTVPRIQLEQALQNNTVLDLNLFKK